MVHFKLGLFGIVPVTVHGWVIHYVSTKIVIKGVFSQHTDDQSRAFSKNWVKIKRVLRFQIRVRVRIKFRGSVGDD